ncbi:MAG: universal stress protein [Opitutae bacterium]|nr:universal stress protein [Opitutae bacterium]
MKKILVPVDLSSATVQVCDAACTLAQSLNARLVLLHVVPPPPPVMGDYYAFSGPQGFELTKGAKKMAAKKMKALGHWFHKRWPETKVLQHTGPPVPVILKAAKLARPDYIVLGSHGHSAMYEMLIGSTAHGVIRKAPCPIVLVPITGRGRRSSR